MIYHYTYSPQGVCSQKIDIELQGDVIQQIVFTGGCNGNLKAISCLVRGLTVAQVQERLSGIQCGPRDTSCSDQLVRGLKAAYAAELAEQSE